MSFRRIAVGVFLSLTVAVAAVACTAVDEQSSRAAAEANYESYVSEMESMVLAAFPDAEIPVVLSHSSWLNLIRVDSRLIRPGTSHSSWHDAACLQRTASHAGVAFLASRDRSTEPPRNTGPRLGAPP